MKYLSMLMFFLSCTESITVDKISGKYVMNGQDAINLFVLKKDGAFERYHSSMLKSKTRGTYTISGKTIILQDEEFLNGLDVKTCSGQSQLTYEAIPNRLIFTELNGSLYLEKVDSFLQYQEETIERLDSMEAKMKNSY